VGSYWTTAPIYLGLSPSGATIPKELIENHSMGQLFHHPFCPHSRYIRLVLSEHGVMYHSIEEKTWERRREFLALNPAGTTPVLLIENFPPVPGAAVIAEFIDEMEGAKQYRHRLLPIEQDQRIEVRRLVVWFNEKFYFEVSGPLVMERVFKRQMTAEHGGGSPDGAALRAARINVSYHLRYLGWLLGDRDWLSGERMTFADLAAAAHLSVVDYLGQVPWSEEELAKNWYMRMKCRPSFRPFLTETFPGIQPAAHYAELDF
jgi:glutathione S-transferase